jgi:hypothetical protein
MAAERAHITRQARYVLRDGAAVRSVLTFDTGPESAIAAAARPAHSASWQRMADG